MTIDYSKYQTTSAIPEAASMIETFRAVGYTVEAAIADIVDNSISACSKNVWVNFEWKGTDSWITIKDDGIGMNNDELIQAMRPGSKNPLDFRDKSDLGRYGLGLKTASFSQCRILSVISKRLNYKPAYWTWDLDFVKLTAKWELIKYLPDGLFTEELKRVESGTIVIWNDIDHLVKNTSSDDNKALDRFMQIMSIVKNHLAMVFHQFIDNGKVKIFFQGREITAWDPFLKSEPTTQIFPTENLQNNGVYVKGYVLPHKSRISEEIYKLAEGTKGWNEHQGFYIYRNERLLLAGDWLGMFRKEEHYKLARLEISLPNNLDTEWQIDIKKSIARPPLILREQLRAYASQVRARAVEVFRHRGKSVKVYPGQKFIPLWTDHKRGDKWFYKINRNHPLIEEIKKQLSKEQKTTIEKLLRFIEETIPTKSIYIKEAEEPECMGKPFEGVDQEPIRLLMQQMYDKLITEGKESELAKSIIINIDPFNHYAHLLEFIN